ncbi:hypothetical protein P7C70_g9336, partial [Phenoliferia sp. Uapishka_3]
MRTRLSSRAPPSGKVPSTSGPLSGPFTAVQGAARASINHPPTASTSSGPSSARLVPVKRSSSEGSLEAESRLPDPAAPSERRERDSRAPPPTDVKPVVGVTSQIPLKVPPPAATFIHTRDAAGRSDSTEVDREGSENGAEALRLGVGSSAARGPVEPERNEGGARYDVFAQRDSEPRAPAAQIGVFAPPVQAQPVPAFQLQGPTPAASPEVKRALHEVASLGPHGGCRMCCGVVRHTDVGDYAEYGKDYAAWRAFRGVELPPGGGTWRAR